MLIRCHASGRWLSTQQGECSCPVSDLEEAYPDLEWSCSSTLQGRVQVCAGKCQGSLDPRWAYRVECGPDGLWRKSGEPWATPECGCRDPAEVEPESGLLWRCPANNESWPIGTTCQGSCQGEEEQVYEIECVHLNIWKDFPRGVGCGGGGCQARLAATSVENGHLVCSEVKGTTNKLKTTTTTTTTTTLGDKAEVSRSGLGCVLVCDFGYVPWPTDHATCEDNVELLSCERPVALLLGGVDDDGVTLSDAEVFPGYGDDVDGLAEACSRRVPEMPRPIAAGFALWFRGEVSVCGVPDPYSPNPPDPSCYALREEPPSQGSAAELLWQPLSAGLSTGGSFADAFVAPGRAEVSGGLDSAEEQSLDEVVHWDAITGQVSKGIASIYVYNTCLNIVRVC